MSEAQTYVIFKHGSKQFRATEGEVLVLDKIEANPGDSLTIKDIIFASPSQASSVILKVLSQFKGKKIISYKKKRRKGYTRKLGYRSLNTKVIVESIA